MTLPPSDKTGKTDRTPAGAATLNEWGIPDWRDPAAYGDPYGELNPDAKWTDDRWRWEFYRRRDDLRELFDKVAAEEPELYLRNPNRLSTLQHGALSKFGYNGIPNPRIGDLPAKDITLVIPEHVTLLYRHGRVEPNGLSGTVGERLKAAGVLLTERQVALLQWTLFSIPVLVGEDEVAIVFNLENPLAPQLKDTEESLELEYMWRQKKRQKRRHPERWLGYLRVLDARDAGASYREIAKLFYAQGVLDRQKNPAGGYGPPAPQAARAMFEAAKGLQVNF